MNTTLHYIHDPMCSWCYAFAPVWSRLQSRLPGGVSVQRWLGGLAPDSSEPMPESMRESLQMTWRRIETMVPETRFNFTFWDHCRPRRSTYPACRAVIAAREQGEAFDVAMTEAIQRAYYRLARNPSDDRTLIELAGELGLDVARFTAQLNAPETQHRLQKEINTAHSMGVGGFPSLILQSEAGWRPIPVSYVAVEPMLEALDSVLC